jgi:hypothetical protein
MFQKLVEKLLCSKISLSKEVCFKVFILEIIKRKKYAKFLKDGVAFIFFDNPC